MKPIALLFSDAHLRRDKFDTFFAFEQIVNTAIEHNIPLIGAGDLIDKQTNRATTIVFLAEQLQRLRKEKLKLYHVQGQHEYDVVPWLNVASNAVHIHKKEVTIGDFSFYGLDWQPFGILQDELSEIPDTANFLVCHQVWSDWMGDVAAPQGSMAQIPGHIKYVQSGDLHQWKLEKRKNADGEKMLVLSCGATTKQKIDEPDKHYYALLYPDGKITQQTLRSRVMIDCSLINRPEDVDIFMSELEPVLAAAAQKAEALELPEVMRKPYMRVTYSSKLPETVRRIEKAVAERALLFFKQLLPAEKLAAYKASKITTDDTAVTPLSVLGEELDKEEHPEVYGLVSRLLQTSEPEVEFAKWRSEFLGENA